MLGMKRRTLFSQDERRKRSSDSLHHLDDIVAWSFGHILAIDLQDLILRL